MYVKKTTLVIFILFYLVVTTDALVLVALIINTFGVTGIWMVLALSLLLEVVVLWTRSDEERLGPIYRR